MVRRDEVFLTWLPHTATKGENRCLTFGHYHTRYGTASTTLFGCPNIGADAAGEFHNFVGNRAITEESFLFANTPANSTGRQLRPHFGFDQPPRPAKFPWTPLAETRVAAVRKHPKQFLSDGNVVAAIRNAKGCAFGRPSYFVSVT